MPTNVLIRHEVRPDGGFGSLDVPRCSISSGHGKKGIGSFPGSPPGRLIVNICEHENEVTATALDCAMTIH